MEDSSVTSQRTRERRALAAAGDEGRRSRRREDLVVDGSPRVVARMGRAVVRRRCRVRAWPMPRLEEQMNIQGVVGMLVVVCGR